MGVRKARPERKEDLIFTFRTKGRRKNKLGFAFEIWSRKRAGHMSRAIIGRRS